MCITRDNVGTNKCFGSARARERRDKRWIGRVGMREKLELAGGYVHFELWIQLQYESVL